MDVFVHIFRLFSQNAREKTDEEYGIMFTFHILTLVILIPDAAALPGLHMPWPKNRRREQCLWKGDPNTNTLGTNLVSATNLSWSRGCHLLTDSLGAGALPQNDL